MGPFGFDLENVEIGGLADDSRNDFSSQIGSLFEGLTINTGRQEEKEPPYLAIAIGVLAVVLLVNGTR
ncbi:MAG: hypothetical protein K8953_05245 [Proteobacteria bacterium]|nr:hypothetical protein [Pseudomonadota bacterium]